MTASIFDMTPFVPSDAAISRSKIREKIDTLLDESRKIVSMTDSFVISRIQFDVSIENAYSSNIIEGESAGKIEILNAISGNFSDCPERKLLQLEALAHIKTQSWINEQKLDLDQIFKPEFICSIHRELYSNVPDKLREVRDSKGDVVDFIRPGEWRRRPVIVGEHVPPDSEDIESLMVKFCDTYNSKKIGSEQKIIAMMAAHHRFMWIHPFMDGNGRVGRLFTDCAFKLAGVKSYGTWCLSRGLAQSRNRYKTLLANADSPRRGDSDGRGQLTEHGLLEFCDYMLDTAITQACNAKQNAFINFSS